MRCLTLAEALADRGINARILARPGSRDVIAGYDRGSIEIVEHPEADDPVTIRAMEPAGCGLFVLDSYRLGAHLLAALDGWATKRMMLDDHPGRRIVADVLLDPTLGREPQDYATWASPGCDMLLGPDFALLRPEFAQTRYACLTERQERPALERIVIALGGTAHDEVLRCVLQGCGASQLAVELHVVTAGATQLPATVGNARVVVHKTTPAIHELMRMCDLAIGAGGGSSWERCCLGLPTLLVELADNQADNSTTLAAAGAAIGLGPAAALTPDLVARQLLAVATDNDRRKDMERHAALLCDGLGARRVVSALVPRTDRDGAVIALRPATMEDAGRMFDWQCLPEVRRFTPNPEPPTWDTHIAWLQGRLGNAARGPFSIVTRAGVPVGVVRLDAISGTHWGRVIEANAFIISILIDPAYHGCGIAAAALACTRDLDASASIYAVVLEGNVASHRLFQQAGYKELENGLYRSGGCGVDGAYRAASSHVT